MRTFALLLVTTAGLAQSWQPAVTNARYESRAFSGDLSSEIRATSPAWFGYAVRTTRGDHESCCWGGQNRCGCSLEGEKTGTIIGTRSNTAVQLEGADEIAVLFRVTSNGIEKVQAYSLTCPLDAGGLPFIWLNGVTASASLSYLQNLVGTGGSGHFLDGALVAIAQHGDSRADTILEQFARSDPSPHTRSQAIFWLAQKAGKRAASTIADAIENDPDTQVKKHAVFALSQLPKDEGVPRLIAIARTQRNPEVRKQAFFWLGQSNDPRALAFIQEVLAK